MRRPERVYGWSVMVGVNWGGTWPLVHPEPGFGSAVAAASPFFVAPKLACLSPS